MRPKMKLRNWRVELAQESGWRRFQKGLQSQVGERGKRLSMGQRQLVSLMRVLVQRPAIFVLDEATASVDPFTETQIQQALQLILADTTSILIAHRPLDCACLRPHHCASRGQHHRGRRS